MQYIVRQTRVLGESPNHPAGIGTFPAKFPATTNVCITSQYCILLINTQNYCPAMLTLPLTVWRDENVEFVADS